MRPYFESKTTRRSPRMADMTEGSPLRHILRFAVPLLVGTVFQQFYNMVDTMIAGYNLGESAIAAIGATTALYSLLINFTNGMNGGCGIVLSRLFGAKRRTQFQKAAAEMILLNAAITILLTAASLVFLRPVMRWLHTPAEIFAQAYLYIAVVLSGLIATVLYNMCSYFLQAIGNSRTPLYFLILSSGINVALDLLFIVGFHTGVVGAAAATVIAQGISALLCGVYIGKHYRELLPRKKDFRTEARLLAEMFQTGLSMALMLSVFSVGTIILQRSINGLGTSIITAHTASRRIYEMLMMPLSTLATANATFVSQNFGAGKMGRIRRVMKQVLLLELAWSVFSVVCAVAAGRFFVGLLTGTKDEKILFYALLNLRASTACFFPLGVLVVLRTAMQSMGHKIVPVLSSFIELLLKIFSCIWLIPVWGYYGVAATEPVIWIVCAVFLTGLYWKWRNGGTG